MHGENQCIGSSVLGPQEAGRTATTTGRALNPGPVERAARGRRAFRAAGAAAQEQRERAKGGHCLKAARGRQGTSADLQQDVLTPWTRHTAPHTSARRNYNDSDCCGGLEAVGRLLALDSRCFQKLRQIPTKSVFLALDSRSFLKLRWIPTKKSVCAGFQYCCAVFRVCPRRMARRRVRGLPRSPHQHQNRNTGRRDRPSGIEKLGVRFQGQLR